MSAPLLIAIAVGFLVLLFALKRVPEGQAFTVHRFGAYRRTLEPGLHWILPLIDTVAHRFRTSGHELNLAPQTAADGSCISGSVYFQVLDPARADDDADHLEDVVLDAVHTAMDGLDETGPLVAERLNGKLKERANRELRSHGLAVVRCRLLVQPQAA